jgi:hypothetical protein
MSHENRSSIQLSDISKVRFECLNCGAASIRTVLYSGVWPVSCENCNQEWSGPFDPNLEKLHAFLQSMQRMTDILEMQRNCDGKLMLKFELAETLT